MIDELRLHQFKNYLDVINFLNKHDAIIPLPILISKLKYFQHTIGTDLNKLYKQFPNPKTSIQCIDFINQSIEIFKRSEVNLFPIDLSDGAGAFQCFPPIYEEAVKTLPFLQQPYYPSPKLSLETIASLSTWGNLKNFSCSPHQAMNFSLFGGGVTRACAEVFKLLNPRDVILIPTPTYGNLIPLAAAFSQVELCPLSYQNQYKLTPSLLQKTIKNYNNRAKKIGLIVFINPVNPTGVVYSQEEINALADSLRHEDCIILEDIIHHDLELKQTALPGTFQASSKAEQTITVFGPSKAYCAAGWRLGISYTKNLTYAAKIQKNLLLSEFAINELYERVAVACYQQSEENNLYLQHNKLEYQLRHALLKLFIVGEENCHLVEDGELLVIYIKKMFPQKATMFLAPATSLKLLTEPHASFFQLLGFAGWKNKSIGTYRLKSSIDVYQILSVYGVLTLPDLAQGYFDKEHLSLRISVSNSVTSMVKVQTNSDMAKNIIAHYMIGCAIERIKMISQQLT